MTTSNITDVQTLTKDVVLQVAKTSNQFKVKQIIEHIDQQNVVAMITLPLNNEEMNRSITVWSGEEYTSIRDTWTNTDLLAKITQLLEQE